MRNDTGDKLFFADFSVAQNALKMDGSISQYTSYVTPKFSSFSVGDCVNPYLHSNAMSPP